MPASESSFSLPKIFAILADAVPATLFYVLPNGIRWLYRTVTLQITSYSLKATHEKITQKATLYLHQGLDRAMAHQRPLLLIHGDQSHPCTLLPLADLAFEQKKRPVFSLYMPTEEDYSDAGRSLLKQGIDKIENLIQESGGSFTDLVAVGHSKGAIQLAHQAFVQRDKRIQFLVSIAGRLKFVPSPDKPCPEPLRPTVLAIEQAMRESSWPLFHTIVAERDWCVPLEAARIRADASTLVPGAMHLNVLYRKETAHAVLLKI